VRLQDLEINLRTRERWPASLAASAFERLESLRIESNGEAVGKMFEGASLPALTSLQVGYDFPLDSLHCPSLRRLRLSGGRLDAGSLAGLIERHPNLDAVQVWDREANEVLTQVKQRFTRDWQDASD
jgi:hypothetical protein